MKAMRTIEPAMRGPILIAAILLVVTVHERAWAANAGMAWRTISWNAESGLQDGGGNETRVAWTTEVRIEGAACMRIFFADVHLGSASYVLLHAANGDLRLDARSMKEYSFGSAILAGDRVLVELHLAAGDRGVSVRIDRALAGTPRSGPGIATLCGGSDDRVASSDNRVGRLTRTVGVDSLPYCTAWRIANGALLTAGHCADLDPDQGGPMLPDGMLDMNGFVEFNVPASNADSTLNLASTNDQYPVDIASVVWRFDGEGQGLGKDWAVFRVNRNANTGLMPHEAYGAPFRVTHELPLAFEEMRVTGFGIDAGAANQTNQTTTAAFYREVANGADIRIDHWVDTTGGNSGAPLIWEFMNLTFGIHTDRGCSDMAGSANRGTSFEVDALENAINDLPGAQTIYVDQSHPMRVTEEGTLFRPFQFLSNAVAATPNNGIVSMYIGIYGLPSGTVLDRPMQLQAPVGGVFILGN